MCGDCRACGYRYGCNEYIVGLLEAILVKVSEPATELPNINIDIAPILSAIAELSIKIDGLAIGIVSEPYVTGTVEFEPAKTPTEKKGLFRKKKKEEEK